jgi:hypothetical protein
MAEAWQVRIDGVRELTRAVARIHPEFIRELQDYNRRLGERIIAAAMPKPLNVGAGRGALPRPSASRNVVKVMAGGSFRRLRVQQWGPKFVPRAQPRPFLAAAAAAEIPRVQEDYLRMLLGIAARSGLSVRRGM